MDFKVGDIVVILPIWNDGQTQGREGKQFEIQSIELDYLHPKHGKTTRLNFDDYSWAEPHEIRHLSKLERALK